jgi:hypothetical protein
MPSHERRPHLHPHQALPWLAEALLHAVLGDVEWPAPPTRQGFYELHHVAGI